MQVSFADEMTLAVTKLLESPDPRYPERRSIPVLLQFVETHARDIPVQNRSRAIGFLAGLTEQNAPDFEGLDDAELTIALVTQLRASLPRPRAFWFRRDKRIAHTDDVATPKGMRATWKEAQKLIEHGQRIAGLLGDVYGVFTFETNDGSYMLSDLAREAARLLGSLLDRAGLSDRDKSSRVRIEHNGHVAEAGAKDGIWIARVTTSEERIVAVERSLDEVSGEIKRLIDSYVEGAESAVDGGIEAR